MPCTKGMSNGVVFRQDMVDGIANGHRIFYIDYEGESPLLTNRFRQDISSMWHCEPDDHAPMYSVNVCVGNNCLAGQNTVTDVQAAPVQAPPVQQQANLFAQVIANLQRPSAAPAARPASPFQVPRRNCPASKPNWFIDKCYTNCGAGKERHAGTRRCRQTTRQTTRPTARPAAARPDTGRRWCPPTKPVGILDKCYVNCANGKTRDRGTRRCRSDNNGVPNVTLAARSPRRKRSRSRSPKRRVRSRSPKRRVRSRSPKRRVRSRSRSPKRRR